MQGRPRLMTTTRPGLLLTPGMQLALRFLQIPALELREAVQQELLTNPVLDLEDEDEADAPGQAGETAAGTEAAFEESGDAAPESEPPEWTWLLDQDLETVRTRDSDAVFEEGVEPWARAGRPTLVQHLLPQLREVLSDPEILAIADYLTGCLDDRGWLGCPVEEVAESLGVHPDRVTQALEALQTLDPAGCGARGLRECLLLQLKARGRQGSLAWRVLDEQFSLLARRAFAGMVRALGVQPFDLEAAWEEIRRLCPHPGRLVEAREVRYIYPDLVVEELRGPGVERNYEVYANERDVPRLRISRSCRRLLLKEASGGASEDAARQYALSRLRSARWLIQALDRRRSTMLRVMKCILEEQRGFFERGIEALRPLTLLQVASRLGLHESTVARVTRHKYVQTPRGIYPLTFFFSGRLRTGRGEDASSRAVRERIRRMIQEEDSARPLSDEGIAGRLEGEGIRIARRTVAKYRDSLKIERAQLRRRWRADCPESVPATDGRGRAG